jgi:hypothetical protein
MGVAPSSKSLPERVADIPFARSAGPVYVVVVSSSVTVNATGNDDDA